jgi:ADP-L-glycero-D-manno-heptose 6-epimerase
MGARTSTLDNDAAALFETNTNLTIDLFTLCADRRWPFLYASSASVYGRREEQREDYPASLSELSPYASSKLAADQALAKLRPAPPLWAGLRLFNVYGPGEAHKRDMKSFVSKCLDAIRLGVPIRLLKGSDAYKRDWVYVDDVARLTCDLLTGGPFPPGVYNVGTGVAVSFVDVAKICMEEASQSVALEVAPFPDGWRPRYQSFTQADTHKLMEIVPDFRFASLREGARHYWNLGHEPAHRRPRASPVLDP